MRLRATATTGTLLASALSVGSLFILASPAAASDDPQVTLCHATGSATNPYVMITVDAAGAYHGHYAQHDDGHPGEDIIPPFLYEEETYSSSNWAQDTKWLLEHGCNPPAEDAPATPTVAPASPTEAPPLAPAAPTEELPLVPASPAAPTEELAPAPAGPAVPPLIPAGDLPLAPAAGPTEEVPLAPAAGPTVAAAASDAAPAVAAGAASAVPVGAVAAGDGSAAEGGGSVLPYVLGGIALAGAGGAAFAARRSSRASA